MQSQKHWAFLDDPTYLDEAIPLHQEPTEPLKVMVKQPCAIVIQNPQQSRQLVTPVYETKVQEIPNYWYRIPGYLMVNVLSWYLKTIKTTNLHCHCFATESQVATNGDHTAKIIRCGWWHAGGQWGANVVFFVACLRKPAQSPRRVRINMQEQNPILSRILANMYNMKHPGLWQVDVQPALPQNFRGQWTVSNWHTFDRHCIAIPRMCF